jgi:hypothetical protein
MDPLMTMWVFFIGCFIGILVGVMLSYRTAVTPLHQSISKLTSQDETYREMMKYYPYDAERFRFLGDPVDWIQFEEEAILFVRFKEGGIPRTKQQDLIKNLVENGKVQWYEYITK